MVGGGGVEWEIGRWERERERERPWGLRRGALCFRACGAEEGRGIAFPVGRGSNALTPRVHSQWSETTVVMKIGDNIKSKDISYSLTPARLTLGIKNEAPVVDG